MSLSSLGFKRPEFKPVRRLSMLAYGKTKTGKSRFGLTMPGPIAVINFDRALTDLLPQFPKKKILLLDLSGEYAGGLNQKKAERLEAQFAAAWAEALKSKEVRSVMVDKTSTLWEIVRWAEFGKIDHVKPHHYVPVNSRMRSYISSVIDSDKNVLMIDDTKEEWVNEKPTGRFVRDGFKHSDSLVQISLQFERKDKTFTTTVDSCAMNADLAGWEFEDENINFPELATMAVPDSNREDWE